MGLGIAIPGSRIPAKFSNLHGLAEFPKLVYNVNLTSELPPVCLHATACRRLSGMHHR